MDERSRRTSRYWESIAQDCQGQSRRLWRRHADKVNRDLLARWLPKHPVEKVLKTDLFDEAVGEGLYPVLALRSRHAAGVDISPSCVRAARTRYPQLQAAVADVRHLPFPDGAFDAIVSNSTLDHFESEDQIPLSLRELVRVLAPGGCLLLTLDNPANLAVWLRNALPRKWLTRPGIVPYYVGATCGPGRLRHYVQQAGLDVVETTAILHCPRLLAVAVGACLSRSASQSAHRVYLRALQAFEHLQRWPSRFLTGYFTAVRAIKPAVRSKDIA